MISDNAVSGSYKPWWQQINVSRLELSPILSVPVRWSSGGDSQAAAGKLFMSAEGLGYTTLAATRFEEFKPARLSIEELTKLRDNWDGYGASSIFQRVRDNALHFVDVIEAGPFAIPPPEISPKATGTISFEWEMPHVEVYLEIGQTRYSGFIKHDQQEGSTFLQGRADSIDQQVLVVIHAALSPSPMRSSSVTEIYTPMPWYELSLT